MVNVEDLLKIQAANPGQGILKTTGTVYGVPSCLLNMTDDLLGLLPSDLLWGLDEILGNAAGGAFNYLLQFLNWILRILGMKMVETPNGFQTIQIGSSLFGINPFDMGGILGGGTGAGGLLGGLQSVLDDAGQLYGNLAGTYDQFQQLKSCLDLLQANLNSKPESLAGQLHEAVQSDPGVLQALVGTHIAKIDGAQEFIKRAATSKVAIAKILRERALNPELEPCFLPQFAELFEGTGVRICVEQEDDKLETPFRLVFGPPQSTKGQFLLTADGLYYDSQTGGLDDVGLYLSSMQLEDIGDKWKFEHDPNVGGKGVQLSLDSITEYVDTLFDPALIDDSIYLQKYYDNDTFIEHLEGQKNKLVYDLSSSLTQLIADEGADSAIVVNARQSLYSEIGRHNDKLNRRKKQIEIRVRTPQLFDPDNILGLAVFPGEIPVNDFSYLGKLNIGIALEKQQKLVFAAAEVEGIVLPLTPKFVKAEPKSESLQVEHLTIPTIGDGGIIHSASAAGDASAQAHILNLVDEITTEGLIATYNFLGSDTVAPSSTEYFVTNSTDLSISSNAKLVAKSSEFVFASGLGIPYLGGIAEFNQTTPFLPSGVGSYVRLPDIPDFRNLTYGLNGFSVETWIHVPTLSLAATGADGWNDAGASSLHRLVLSCDNVGGNVTSINPSSTLNSFGSQKTRGLVMGFTKDRQITSEQGPSNLPADHTALRFFVAPTQSINASAASFIAEGGADGCTASTKWLNASVDVTTSTTAGTSFESASSTFVNATMVADPKVNELRFYLDGNLLITSSLSYCFGQKKHFPVAVPTFTQGNSFEYGGSSTSWNVIAPILGGGPKWNFGAAYSFTPWIVGGGYTDGNMVDDKGFHFLNEYGGISSGLKGHVGSLKFYKKPLNNKEVLQNYDAQKGLFKNITT